MRKSKNQITGLALLILTITVLAGCAGNAVTQEDTQKTTMARAKQAYLGGQYQQAAILLQQLADQGDPQARYALGYMYYYGLGVRQDFQKSVLLFSQAATANYPKAIEALKRLSGSEKKPPVIDLRSKGLKKSGIGISPPANNTKPATPAKPPAKTAAPEQGKQAPVTHKSAVQKNTTTVSQNGHGMTQNDDHTLPPAYVMNMAKKNAEAESNRKDQKTNTADLKKTAASEHEDNKQAFTNETALEKIEDNRFIVQIISSKRLPLLKRFIHKNKLENVLIVRQHVKGEIWYSVLQGEYSQWSEANEALKTLQQRGFKDAWIVKAGYIKSRAVSN